MWGTPMPKRPRRADGARHASSGRCRNPGAQGCDVGREEREKQKQRERAERAQWGGRWVTHGAMRRFRLRGGWVGRSAGTPRPPHRPVHLGGAEPRCGGLVGRPGDPGEVRQHVTEPLRLELVKLHDLCGEHLGSALRRCSLRLALSLVKHMCAPSSDALA